MAIPLITINEADNSFEVNEHALQLLAQIRCQLCVTAAAGLYRTGKSALLNWLARTETETDATSTTTTGTTATTTASTSSGRSGSGHSGSTGFTVGPTINRCTRGIWLWGEPIMCTTATGEECACIILDTEGLGGVESNLKYDTRIFSLVILLCSTLVYNSMGSIDENAISNLSLVTQLSENIKLSNKPNDANNDDTLEFHKVFPSFIWVIRDFTLDLEDEDGYDITPTQYLNTALEQSPGYDKQTMERNRIRHMLTSFFPDRECVTLIRPISDEEVLQQVDAVPYNDLREEFREGISVLRKLIFENARPKTIDGKTLSGSMFGGLVRSYVKAINEGGVPTISSAWEGVSLQECVDAKEKSFSAYQFVMNALISDSPFPINDEELMGNHSKASSEALQMYQQRAVGPSAKVVVRELECDILRLLRGFEEENKAAGVVFCEKLLIELYDSLIRVKLVTGNKVDETNSKHGCVYASDMQQFRHDWDTLVNLYSQQARGPSKWKILSETLKVKMIDCSNVIINFVTSDYESQMTLLHQLVQDSATKLSTVDAEFHVLKDSTDKTDAKNKDLEAKLIDLGVKCKAQDVKLADLSSQTSDLSTKYDTELDLRTRMEEKMEKSKKRVSELEVFENRCFDLTHEKDVLESRIKELEEDVVELKKKKKKCVIS